MSNRLAFKTNSFEMTAIFYLKICCFPKFTAQTNKENQKLNVFMFEIVGFWGQSNVNINKLICILLIRWSKCNHLVLRNEIWFIIWLKLTVNIYQLIYCFFFASIKSCLFFCRQKTSRKVSLHPSIAIEIRFILITPKKRVLN